MTTMPVEPGILRMKLDPARVDVDRLAETSEIPEAPSIPYDGIRVRRRAIVRRLRFGELRFVSRFRIGREWKRTKRIAEERDPLNGGRFCRRRGGLRRVGR